MTRYNTAWIITIRRKVTRVLDNSWSRQNCFGHSFYRVTGIENLKGYSQFVQCHSLSFCGMKWYNRVVTKICQVNLLPFAWLLLLPSFDYPRTSFCFLPQKATATTKSPWEFCSQGLFVYRWFIVFWTSLIISAYLPCISLIFLVSTLTSYHTSGIEYKPIVLKTISSTRTFHCNPHLKNPR